MSQRRKKRNRCRVGTIWRVTWILVEAGGEGARWLVALFSQSEGRNDEGQGGRMKGRASMQEEGKEAKEGGQVMRRIGSVCACMKPSPPPCALHYEFLSPCPETSLAPNPLTISPVFTNATLVWLLHIKDFKTCNLLIISGWLYFWFLLDLIMLIEKADKSRKKINKWFWHVWLMGHGILSKQRFVRGKKLQRHKKESGPSLWQPICKNIALSCGILTGESSAHQRCTSNTCLGAARASCKKKTSHFPLLKRS